MTDPAAQAPIIYPEEGWAVLESGLRPRAEMCIAESPPERKQFLITPPDSFEFSSLYTTVYTMSTQKGPNDFTQDLYKRYCDHLRDVSARAVALLAGKQGIQLTVALFGVWKSFMMYAKFTRGIFKYIDRFNKIPRRLEDVAYDAFGKALCGVMSRVPDVRDIALLQAGVRCMAAHVRMSAGGREADGWAGASSNQLQAVEAKWQACVAAQDAGRVELLRRELAFMLVLCVKGRAKVRDDIDDRLQKSLRFLEYLARDFDKTRSYKDLHDDVLQDDLVGCILWHVAPEGARPLEQAVAELLASLPAADM